MRFQPSATRSSRSPKSSAPVGQVVEQEGSIPAAWRSAQKVHLRMKGTAAIPLKFRNLEGAGHHTVAAADAAAVVVDHRPRIQFDERRHRAGGDTGGVITVHALAFDKIPGHFALGVDRLPER